MWLFLLWWRNRHCFLPAKAVSSHPCCFVIFSLDWWGAFLSGLSVNAPSLHLLSWPLPSFLSQRSSPIVLLAKCLIWAYCAICNLFQPGHLFSSLICIYSRWLILSQNTPEEGYCLLYRNILHTLRHGRNVNLSCEASWMKHVQVHDLSTLSSPHLELHSLLQKLSALGERCLPWALELPAPASEVLITLPFSLPKEDI